MDDAIATKLLTREPLSPADATRLVKHIVLTGSVLWWDHALAAMADDKMTTPDVLNVLRAGFSNELADYKENCWRYRMRTARFVVVVTFESATELSVVTAWRLTR